MTIYDLQKKKNQQKISMLTCYDFWSAKILSESDVDILLVGDSLSMVMHGMDSTVHADIDVMALHTKSVSMGAPKKFIVGDMPFLSTRKSLDFAMEAVEKLMKAGANAIKIEGWQGHEKLIPHIVASGVPVMGHLGLTPQSVHQLGGHRVQGRDEEAAERICTEAKKLEEAGCFSLVLECVPSDLAKKVTENLKIPTIGIGAGPDVDGQVLVLQDMLGMQADFKPKFLRRYGQGHEWIQKSVNEFHNDVINKNYPSTEESYS